MEDLNCGTTSPGFAPLPVPSSIELKPIDLAAADDEKDTNKCEHFTIRGYVAEVRKRDTKIGCPFALLRKHFPDQHACSLPPLSITRFRWWNCHNCLHNSLSAETALSDGVFTGAANGEGKHQTFYSEANENVASYPPGLQKQSDGKSSEERSTEAGRSSTVSSSGFNPQLHYGNKGNESLIAELGKGGCVTSNGYCDNSHEKQNLLGKPGLAHAEGEIIQPIETGQRGKIFCAECSETAYQGKDDPEMIVDVKTMVNELNFGISGCQTPGIIPISCSNNIAAPTQKHGRVLVGLADLKEPYNSTAVKCVMPMDAVSPSHASDDCNASNADMRLVHNRIETENDASQSTSNANLQHRKARKVRLLNDILKGEESRVADKVFDSYADEKTNENESHKVKRPDAQKRKATHLHHNKYYATKKNRVKPTRDHYSNELHQDEDDGPSLMHWLQKRCKKSLSLKGDNEINHDGNEVGLTKISGDASPMVHHVESCGMREEKTVTRERKQAESTTSSQILQQRSMNGKNKMIIEDLPTKECNSKTVPTTEGAGISENNVHHCHEILSDTLKKVILKRKKSKAPRGQDDPCQKLRLKRSFGGQKGKTINSFKVKKKIVKQRTMREGNHEAADDFPMDIVELLARNQYERRLLNANIAAEKLQNLSEMAERMTDYKFLDDFDDHGHKVSHQLDENLPQQKSQPNNEEDNAQPPIRIDLNVDHRMNDCYSLSYVKQGLFLASEVPKALSHNSGHPNTEGQLPFGTRSNCLPHKFCCNRVALHASQLFQTANAGTERHSFRNTHYMPSVPISGSNLGLVTGKPIDYFIQESLSPFPEGSLRTAADRTNSRVTMNPSNARPHMQKRKALESSIHRKTVQHSTSMFGNAGDCQARFMMPLNTNTNDTTAAMHMLTLTNWAAYSREHLCGARVDLNPYGSCHESEFHYDDINTYKHPWINGNPDQELQPGNSCKPIRPVPRVGVLGSLLRKELSTSSNNCRAPCSFKDGHSDQLSSFKTNALLKMKDSQSTSQTKVANCQISTSGDEKSEHMVASSDSRPHSGGSLGRVAAASSTVIKSKGRAVQPHKNAYSTTICVVNRNPADFASPDEDSEYMVGYEWLKPRDKTPTESIRCSARVDGQKRRKVKKLTALKGIMRS